MDETDSRKVVTFGGIVMMLVGAFNVLDGVVALANPDYEHAELLVGNMTAWGWFLLVFGVLQLGVGFAVLRGSEIALWPGIVLCAVNALGQLANFDAFPLWSVAIIAADMLVIYGFTVRGMALGIETIPSEPSAVAPPVREPAGRDSR